MVAIDEALVPVGEQARLDALHAYDILDTPPDGAFDRITRLAARLFDVPIAIVSLVDHDRIWFKSHHGLDLEQVDRDAGLCASAILHDEPWVVSDARRDPRALANPLVAGQFGLQFYAGVPLRTADGHNLGTLCIIDFEPRNLTGHEIETLEDLSGMVVSEMEVRLASRRAAEAARHREDLNEAFVAMLSHELRTPVTTIYAAAQILSRDRELNAVPRARELFPDITTEADRLLRLIDNLLVLTRVERGVLEASGEPVLLQRVLPEMVAREARRWPGRTVSIELDGSLPPAAGDPIFIEQVVTNLVSNALKYSPAHAPIQISGRVVADEVEMRIRDRGIGVPSNQREQVFDLLVRTHEATLKAPGAGIGLYVCRRLLESMGGRIWVEPTEGDGTAFVFRLPVASGDLDDAIDFDA